MRRDSGTDDPTMAASNEDAGMPSSALRRRLPRHLQPPQRHLFDQVALALGEDQVSALACRQDVLA